MGSLAEPGQGLSVPCACPCAPLPPTPALGHSCSCWASPGSCCRGSAVLPWGDLYRECPCPSGMAVAQLCCSQASREPQRCVGLSAGKQRATHEPGTSPAGSAQSLAVGEQNRRKKSICFDSMSSLAVHWFVLMKSPQWGSEALMCPISLLCLGELTLKYPSPPLLQLPNTCCTWTN